MDQPAPSMMWLSPEQLQSWWQPEQSLSIQPLSEASIQLHQLQRLLTDIKKLIILLLMLLHHSPKIFKALSVMLVITTREDTSGRSDYLTPKKYTAMDFWVDETRKKWCWVPNNAHLRVTPITSGKVQIRFLLQFFIFNEKWLIIFKLQNCIFSHFSRLPKIVTNVESYFWIIGSKELFFEGLNSHSYLMWKIIFT